MTSRDTGHGWNYWKEADRKPQSVHSLHTIGSDRERFAKKYPAVLAMLSDSQSLSLSELRSNWPKIVGNLHKHTTVEEIKEGVLVIKADRPVYAQEIQLHQRSILHQLEKFGIPVKSLKVKVK